MAGKTMSAEHWSAPPSDTYNQMLDAAEALGKLHKSQGIKLTSTQLRAIGIFGLGQNLYRKALRGGK